MDIEDAHKLKLLTTEETKQLFLAYFPKEQQRHIEARMGQLVDDINEQIVYLRSCVINCLEQQCVQVFIKNEQAILSGTFEGSLIKHIDDLPRKAYEQCENTAYKKIYHCKDVVDIEIAGYKVIMTLTDLMVQAVTHSDRAFSQLLINRVSTQYDILAPTLYERIMAVLDYISGMTDVFALDLYRKINGMSLPAV
jgi:dGTPase